MKWGNPFLDDGTELLSLDSHDVLDESVVATVCTVEKLGKDQYTRYYESVLKDRTVSIHDPIRKSF